MASRRRQTGAEAYRREVAATPAARRAKTQGRSAARGAEVLRLVHHRRPFEILDRLAPAQRRQLTRLTRQNNAGKPSALVHHEDWAPMELVDVHDVAANTVTHQLYIWPWGSGELFVHNTTTRAGAIIQHGFDMTVEDPAFRSALAAAYARAKPALAETVDFQLDKPRAPTPAEEEAADAKLAAAAYQRLEQALGKTTERYRDYAMLSKPRQAAIRDVFGHVHVELIASRHDLVALGMPPTRRLRSWCGHSPASELEERAGKWPVWKWLLEAGARRASQASAIAAIAKAVPRAKLAELAWMTCDPFYDYGFWGETLEYEGRKPVLGPKQSRMVQLIAGLLAAAGPEITAAFALRVKRDEPPEMFRAALVAIARAGAPSPRRL